MPESILFTSGVIKTLRELPENERITVASALIADMVLGEQLSAELPDFEYLIYTMIADNIRRDSCRYSRAV